MIIVFTGGRDTRLTSKDYEKLSEFIKSKYQDMFDRYIKDDQGEVGELEFHVGDARGIDSDVYDFLMRIEFPWRVKKTIKKFYADWDQYGKGAGHIRNKEMIKGSDLLIAYPGGKGTANAIQTANRLGIPVIRIG